MKPPSLLQHLALGVGVVVLGDAMLLFYWLVVKHSEFAVLGSALLLVYLVPAGLAAGLLLFFVKRALFAIRGPRED